MKGQYNCRLNLPHISGTRLPSDQHMAFWVCTTLISRLLPFLSSTAHLPTLDPWISAAKATTIGSLCPPTTGMRPLRAYGPWAWRTRATISTLVRAAWGLHPPTLPQAGASGLPLVTHGLRSSHRSPWRDYVCKHIWDPGAQLPGKMEVQHWHTVT
jgi:hypothetical protein